VECDVAIVSPFPALGKQFIAAQKREQAEKAANEEAATALAKRAVSCATGISCSQS